MVLLIYPAYEKAKNRVNDTSCLDQTATTLFKSQEQRCNLDSILQNLSLMRKQDKDVDATKYDRLIIEKYVFPVVYWSFSQLER